DLPVYRIRAEEGEIHARVARIGGRVDHLVGTVLVVAGGEEGLVIQQLAPVRVRIDVGRVGHVIARALETADQLDLPVQEQSGTIVRKGSVKRNLDGPGRAGHRVRAIAVVVVETLAGAAVVGPVVIGRIGVDRVLVEEGGGT